MKISTPIFAAALLLSCNCALAAAPQAGGSSAIQREIIPGSELMSHAERERYRLRMRAAATPEAQARERERHVERMRERARLRGLDLADPQKTRDSR